MMHDLAWKVSDVPAVSAPSNHWQESSFANEADTTRTPRPGHSLGNVGVRQSVSPRLQPKLTVSQPGDRAELEADTMAATVMSMPDPGGVAARQEDDSVMPTHVQRKCTECEKDTANLDKPGSSQTEAGTAAQRVAEEDEQVATMPAEEDEQVATMPAEEEEQAQAKSQSGGTPEVNPELQSEIQAVHSAGQPMSRESREFFEPRFGANFGDVRIHTGSQAAGVARQLNAKAFTVGNNITFGEGQYSPSSNTGKQLMAHELTHVLQQRGR